MKLSTLPRSELSSLRIQMDMELVRRQSHRPVGSRLTHFLRNWENVSGDPWIREAITGHRLDFISMPRQYSRLQEVILEPEKTRILAREVEELASQQAIVQVRDDGEGFISPLFLVPKSDDSWRPVISLKLLNTFIQR